MRISLSTSMVLALASLSFVHCNGDHHDDAGSDTVLDIASDRVSSDSSTTDTTMDDASTVDDMVTDDSTTNDVTPPTDGTSSTCDTMDLGMAVGAAVATGDTTSGTDRQQASAACGMSAGPDVAYAWRAPSAGSFTIDTNGTTHDTILYVRDGSCSGSEVACNDDAPNGSGGASAVCITATAGQQFVIVVDGFDSTARGPYTLNISAANGCTTN